MLMPSRKINVLVVDDSALMRTMLTEIINSAHDMQVISTAGDAASARDEIRRSKPDVVTLDIEMPGQSGLDFLQGLMRQSPLPVVMVSALTERGSETALRALELGAVDYVAKPRNANGARFQSCAEQICEKIRAAFNARSGVAKAGGDTAPQRKPAGIDGPALSGITQHEYCIMIGASTGGTEAIKEVLMPLPEYMPPIFIVQHMPEMFTGSFARRLDSLSRIAVKEAEDGERARPGVAYLAPGHSHLAVRKVAGGYMCVLSDANPVNRHRPSVDVLFNSAAEVLGSRALGVLLTGMGKDGAQGLLSMRKSGAWTVAQDKDSCVVWGMPREAALIGGAEKVASLREIPGLLVERLRGPRRLAV